MCRSTVSQAVQHAGMDAFAPVGPHLDCEPPVKDDAKGASE